jgi:sporulation protein YlmC with PRC-barrel domain
MKIEIKKSYRCSNLVGMPVKNARGEDVGKIEEVVIDLDRNRLMYAALSFGGFLGVGSKVFAIPWDAMSLKFDERSTYFLLDVDPEKLKAAPGFARENWPDMSDPNWAKDIDAFYREAPSSEPAEPDRVTPVEKPWTEGDAAPEAATELSQKERAQKERADVVRRELPAKEEEQEEVVTAAR